jgi:hypothetical protein
MRGDGRQAGDSLRGLPLFGQAKQLISGLPGFVCCGNRPIYGSQQAAHNAANLSLGLGTLPFLAFGAHSPDFPTRRKTVCEVGSKKSKNPRIFRGF